MTKRTCLYICVLILAMTLALLCLSACNSVATCTPDVIIAQDGNYNLFPDIVKKTDGSLMSVYYSSKGGHAPYKFGDELGVVRYTDGSKDGKSWSEPKDLVNQDLLIEWGLGVWYSPSQQQYFYLDKDTTQHYTLDQSNDKTAVPALPDDATIAVEARDPNLGILNDGTLVFTFFSRLPWQSRLDGHTYWTENNSFYTWGRTYIMYSVDDGTSWSEPTEIQCDSLDRNCAKRGNIAVYSNDTILIPMYGMSTSATTEFTRKKWSTANVQAQLVFPTDQTPTNQNGTWQWIAEHSTCTVDGIDHSVKSAFGYGVTEGSFGVADDGVTTYAMLRSGNASRPGGDVLVSVDYGATWATIANSSPNSQQAGWHLMKDGNFFVTWSQVPVPRPIYGNIFNPKKEWDSTQTKMLYKTDKTSGDMGDPSGVQLDDGTLLAIFYDSNIKAIGGVFFSPDKW